MPIRNSAKAIVLDGERVLLNRCTSRFGEYYALPGGGQNTGETLTEAVRRELIEETGYSVKPLRLSAIYERISVRPSLGDDGLTHKLYFIFLCALESGVASKPTEHDKYQIGLEWVNIRDIPLVNLFPRAIRANFDCLMSCGETIYIGSEREKCEPDN